MRLAALGLVLALGAGAGLLLDRMQLRGVGAPLAPDAASIEPAVMAGPDPVVAIPDGFAPAFADGISALKRGDAHHAARAFEVARRANPHAPEAYVNLGVSYLEMGKPAAAREVFEQASAIAPRMASAYYGLAESLEALGDLAGARGAMRTFLHLAPKEDPFRRRAAAALWEWGEGSTQPAAPPPVPSPAGPPLFAAPLETLDGVRASLADRRGKVLVLNIWASWCGPCRAELPALDALNRQLDPAEAMVVGVSIDRDPVFTREFLRELGIGFPNYWDREKALTGEILAATSLPVTLIVAPDGEIATRHVGARDWSDPAIVSAIRSLSGPVERTAALARLKEALE